MAACSRDRRPSASLRAVRAGRWCAIAAALACLVGAGCQRAAVDPSAGASQGATNLPGVDIHDFTAREQREFSDYVTQMPAPCPGVAVPIAQCIEERRPCPACLPAAQAIAKGVRDGLAHDQVEEMYKERFDPSSARDVPVDGSPTRGPATAPVTVVEFADFECPFCQRVAPELDAMWEARKDKVRFVYKFLPLSMHPHADAAARAAIAAQMQGKFWEMHHELFANGEHLEPEDIDRYARRLGLDMARFHADMASDAATARIEADRKLADALGVKGTPTVFIDGREYDLKADLGEWVDEEIAARTPKHAS